MSITKNQHYIPQFYQKYWEDLDHPGHLYHLLKKENSKIEPVGIKSNCAIDYLYEVNPNNPDNIFEKHYKNFEDKVSIEYSQLINNLSNIKCLQRISKSDKKIICKLYANLSARNPLQVYSPKTLSFLNHFTLGYKDPYIDIRTIQNIWALGQAEAIEGYTGNFEKN